MGIKEKIIYEPFKNLKEQEAFEKDLKEEAELNLNPIYEEGTVEDIKEAERKEELNSILNGRLYERIVTLNK